jgi:DedD protein
MPWPFSRNDTESADRQAGEGAARRAEARDPAAELRSQSRRRLIGAAVLLLAAVIVVPLLLDTTPRPVREDIAITVATPSPPPPPPKPVDNAPPPDEKIAEPAPVRGEPPPPEEPPARPAAAPALPPSPAPPLPTAAPQPPPVPPAKPAAAAASAERFAVQVAALSSPSAAKELAGRLKKSGFGAYVEAVSTAEGTLHRVRVGPFAGRDEAQRAAEKVKAAGHKATVVGG